MAREFNGTSQGAEAASVDLSGVGTMTISLWVYVAAWGGAGTFNHIFHHQDNPEVTPGFRVFDNGTDALLEFQSYGDVGGNHAQYSRPSTGTWHNFIFTIDRSLTNEVDFYLDASLQTPSARPSTSDNTNNLASGGLHLGSKNETSDWWAGRMAEVAVYNKILTATEIGNIYAGLSPLAVRPQALKCYAPLFGINSPEPDFSGNGKSFTLTASPTRVDHPPRQSAIYYGRPRRVERIMSVAPTPGFKVILTQP